jgi:hypothetical protein
VPAPKTVAGFSFSPGIQPQAMIGRSSFDLSKPFRRIFCISLTARKRFDTSGKSLAKYHHRKSFRARTEQSAAGFLFEVPESDGGRTSTPQLQRLARASRACRRPSPSSFKLAGARERAGMRRAWSAPQAAPNGIRFAPQTVCSHSSRAAHFFRSEADDRVSDIACARRSCRHCHFGGTHVIDSIDEAMVSDVGSVGRDT